MRAQWIDQDQKPYLIQGVDQSSPFWFTNRSDWDPWSATHRFRTVIGYGRTPRNIWSRRKDIQCHWRKWRQRQNTLLTSVLEHRRPCEFNDFKQIRLWGDSEYTNGVYTSFSVAMFISTNYLHKGCSATPWTIRQNNSPAIPDVRTEWVIGIRPT